MIPVWSRFRSPLDEQAAILKETSEPPHWSRPFHFDPRRRGLYRAAFPKRRSNMADRIEKHGLKISPVLFHFIEKEALPGSGVDPTTFWAGFAALAVKLMPQNRALLAERDRLQAAIDAWHKAHPARPIDALDY